MKDSNIENSDNLNELKEMWNELNNRLSRLEEATIEEGRRVSRENIRSAQEDLAMTYKRFTIIGFTMAAIMPIMFGVPDSIFNYPTMTYRVIVSLSMCAYFLTCALMDFYLFRRVNDMDLAVMPVSVIRETALRLKKKHHIFMMILIPIAICVLFLMTYPIISEIWIAVLVGAVVGLAIGLSMYFKMMNDYKQILAEG